MSVDGTVSEQDNPTAAAVRAEFARRRITQEQAAAALGMAQPMVSRRLSGRVEFSASELRALALWLGIPAETLLGIERARADVGAAQPSALGVAVLFLAAILLGVTLPAGTPVALLVAVVAGWVLVGMTRGAIAAERGRRD